LSGSRKLPKRRPRSRPGFVRLLRPNSPNWRPFGKRLVQHPRVALAALQPAGLLRQRPAVIAQANRITQQYLSDPASVDATLGQTALSIAARNGDSDLFDKLQKVAETSTNPEFQVGALRLLAEFEDPALVQRSLDYAVSGKVRNQDAAIQFAIALQIPATRDLAWKYIQSHWDKVQAQLTTEMGAVLVGSTSGFCSVASRDEVKSFFSAHKVPPPSCRSNTPSNASTAASSCARFRNRISSSGSQRNRNRRPQIHSATNLGAPGLDIETWDTTAPYKCVILSGGRCGDRSRRTCISMGDSFSPRTFATISHASNSSRPDPAHRRRRYIVGEQHLL